MQAIKEEWSNWQMETLPFISSFTCLEPARIGDADWSQHDLMFLPHLVRAASQPASKAEKTGKYRVKE